MLQLDSANSPRLCRRHTWLKCVRLLLAPALLLLSSLACAFGGQAPAPLWRYEVPAAWRDSSTDIQVAGERVYLAPKLPPVYDKATPLTKDPETHVLTALELATGKRIWEQQVDIKFATEWLVDAGRILYIPPLQSPAGEAPAQSVVALDTATGAPAWRFDAMQVGDTLLVRGECLFIFDTRNELLCLDVGDGRVRGSYPGVPVAELGAAGADVIRTRITDEAFYQLSPTGVLRTYAIPQPTLVYSVPLAFEGVPDALDVKDRRAFVRTRLDETMAPRLYVFALPSGQLLWDAPDTGRLAQVVNHDGRQYALIFRLNANDVTPGVMVFDLTTGENLYAVDAINHEYWVGPGGRLITYIGAGQLVAHDLATGEHLRSAKSDSNGVVAIGGQGDAVYLVASNTPFMSVTDDVNRLEVFDVQHTLSGAVLYRFVIPAALQNMLESSVLLHFLSALDRLPGLAQCMAMELGESGFGAAGCRCAGAAT